MSVKLVMIQIDSSDWDRLPPRHNSQRGQLVVLELQFPPSNVFIRTSLRHDTGLIWSASMLLLESQLSRTGGFKTGKKIIENFSDSSELVTWPISDLLREIWSGQAVPVLKGSQSDEHKPSERKIIKWLLMTVERGLTRQSDTESDWISI